MPSRSSCQVPSQPPEAADRPAGPVPEPAGPPDGSPGPACQPAPGFGRPPPAGPASPDDLSAPGPAGSSNTDGGGGGGGGGGAKSCGSSGALPPAGGGGGSLLRPEPPRMSLRPYRMMNAGMAILTRSPKSSHITPRFRNRKTNPTRTTKPFQNSPLAFRPEDSMPESPKKMMNTGHSVERMSHKPSSVKANSEAKNSNKKPVSISPNRKGLSAPAA